MASDILIVDDEPTVRELLKMVLRTMNLPFREAADGVEALERIAQAQPRLVILDMMMPRLDGLGVLKKLKADAETASLPVLLFTTLRITKEMAHELGLPPTMIMNKGTLSVKDFRAVVAQVVQAAPAANAPVTAASTMMPPPYPPPMPSTSYRPSTPSSLTTPPTPPPAPAAPSTPPGGTKRTPPTPPGS